jgi:hypothetical protein
VTCRLHEAEREREGEEGQLVTDTWANRARVGSGRPVMWAGLRVWPGKE